MIGDFRVYVIEKLINQYVFSNEHWYFKTYLNGEGSIRLRELMDETHDTDEFLDHQLEIDELEHRAKLFHYRLDNKIRMQQALELMGSDELWDTLKASIQERFK